MRFSLAVLLVMIAAMSPALLAQSDVIRTFEIGRAKYEDRDFAGAVTEFNKGIELDPLSANMYQGRGLAKNGQGDSEGAIADFTKAIELNPEFAAAYYARGSVRYTRRDMDGAVADLSQAIIFNPAFAAAYNERGGIKMEKGDLAGALADVQDAIDFDSRSVAAHLNRGRIKEIKGDLPGALEDFSKAIELDPKSPRAYATRAAAQYQAGALKSSLKDYRACLEHDQTTQDYPRLFIWIIRTQLGEAKEATAELAAFFEKRWSAVPVDWPAKLAANLCGKLATADLLTAATMPDKIKENGRICEAWFYVGMKQLLDGDKKSAAASFQKAMATDAKNYREFGFAQDALKKLEK